MLRIGVGAYGGAFGHRRDVGEGSRRKGHGHGGESGELPDSRTGCSAQGLFGEGAAGQLADARKHQNPCSGFRQARQAMGLVGRPRDAEKLQRAGQDPRSLGAQRVGQQDGTVQALGDPYDESVAGRPVQVLADDAKGDVSSPNHVDVSSLLCALLAG